MREIKFRAWNKIWKMMSMVDKIEFEDGKPYSVSTTIEATDFDHTDEWCDYEVGDEIILQQFTGLQDKNGKDIYEGDVVLIPDTYTDRITEDGRGPQEPDNHLSEVKYLEGCFKFIVKENADILSKGEYTFEELEDETGTEELEVIGNIYENPELL